MKQQNPPLKSPVEAKYQLVLPKHKLRKIVESFYLSTSKFLLMSLKSNCIEYNTRKYSFPLDFYVPTMLEWHTVVYPALRAQID